MSLKNIFLGWSTSPRKRAMIWLFGAILIVAVFCAGWIAGTSIRSTLIVTKSILTSSTQSESSAIPPAPTVNPVSETSTIAIDQDIPVLWMMKPPQASDIPFLASAREQFAQEGGGVAFSTSSVMGVYLSGQVQDGDFKGARIYAYAYCVEMCVSETLFTVMIFQNKSAIFDGWTIDRDRMVNRLSRNVFSVPTSTQNGFSFHYQLAEWVPDAIKVPGGKLALVPDSIQLAPAQCVFSACDELERVFSADGVAMSDLFERRRANSDEKYTILSNGYMFAYVSQPIMDGIVWEPAFASTTDKFSQYRHGGCGGIIKSDNIISPADIQKMSLRVIGYTSAGSPLLGPANFTTSDIARGLYNEWYFINDDGIKPSFEQFLEWHPIPFFIWKDALGEYVQYRIDVANAGVECGKPVIYLYPETTMSVKVQLSPSIKVTKSEPTYPAHGWNVLAEPSGKLWYEGKSYGSLFWEGTGVGYEAPKTGFIIKDGEVDTKLASILARYGLTERESAEFRDFWVPLMQGAPYYRVSFITGKEWADAAPLSVVPPPKTVLRIFMDWQKLAASVSIPEPSITAPARKGFALVEWGGLLRK